MSKETAEGMEMLWRIYEMRRSNIRVNPRWLATEVMQTLDPERMSHPIEYSMAHLQLRQLARALCAGRWEKEDRDIVPEQHDLFPDLQPRYPSVERSADQEPEYVLLEHMTDADIKFNVSRLRSEANAKLAHADALEAWGKSRTVAA